MSIYLSELAQGFDNLTCVTRSHTVQQALDIMLKAGYTQLPVVDGDKKLIGVVSEHSILQTLYDERKAYDQFAKLPVIDCLDDDGHTTLTPQDDIFAAMERLERTAYVVIVDANRVPVGIVTSYDTGQIFSAIGEVLVRARDIEERLREYIQRAYPTAEAMATALRNAYPSDDNKDIDRLTFGDLITIIVSGKNWPAFDKVLGPQFRFRHHMEPARDIRNDIAHYRRQVDKQHDIPTMKRCLEWLEAHERLPLTLAVQTRIVVADTSSIPTAGISSTSGLEPNYLALDTWFWLKFDSPFQAEFAEIEEAMGTPLPPAASEHLSWWANDPEQPQANIWLSNGWRVADIDLQAKLVTFVDAGTKEHQPDTNADPAAEE